MMHTQMQTQRLIGNQHAGIFVKICESMCASWHVPKCLCYAAQFTLSACAVHLCVFIFSLMTAQLTAS